MSNLCLNQLLAAQMNRNPDANAIIAPGRTSLTYRQLTHHINHVVATLNSIGIGRNDRVAIVLPNGPEMAVAFLAVAAGPLLHRSIRPIAPTNLTFISERSRLRH
jgi:acyl-CoA synthetase (AMP-forming)/AMP-acid ligase II